MSMSVRAPRICHPLEQRYKGLWALGTEPRSSAITAKYRLSSSESGWGACLWGWTMYFLLRIFFFSYTVLS